MQLVVNGEARTVDFPHAEGGLKHDVDALLVALGLPRERVAVEVNGHIVPKAERAQHTLKDGDVLEIVTLVGGG